MHNLIYMHNISIESIFTAELLRSQKKSAYTYGINLRKRKILFIHSIHTSIQTEIGNQKVLRNYLQGQV